MYKWRDKARRAIITAIEQATKEKVDIKKAIRDSYPFGTRANHPYRMWLKEQGIALENPQEYYNRFAVVNCIYCRDRNGGCLACLNKFPKEGDAVLSPNHHREPRPYDVVLGGKTNA